MKELDAINKVLRKNGMLEIAIISPFDCIGADVNARYFLPETMMQLVENVKDAGHLESVPLVYKDSELPKGKYRIISGHHRVDSAKEAGLESIMVMIAEPKDMDEVISKQLSHNSLVGTDDKVILKQLFDSITDIDMRMRSGLNSELDKVNYSTLNFKVNLFKEMLFAFSDADVDDYDRLVEQIKESSIRKAQAIRVHDMDTHKPFIEAIMKIKGAENIKNNGAALSRMIELAMERIEQIQDEA